MRTLDPLARKALVAIAVVALAGAAAAQETPFEPTGELRLSGFSGVGAGASFDETRIVGPAVNLTRRDDGTWAGELGGHDVDLHVEKDRVTGSNVNITYSQKGGSTRIEGLFYGRRIRIELDRKKLQGRLGACSLDLLRKGPQIYSGDVGCMAARQGLGTAGRVSLTLIGQAAAENPPLPHVALAFVALMQS